MSSGLPPRIGARYDVSGWFWKRADYWAWSRLRDKSLSFISRTTTAGLMLILVGSLVTLGYSWSENLHRTWLHYSMKERERMYFIKLINKARDDNKIPASLVKDFVA